MTKPILYHYWRSSSSWRVRWALALKNVEAELVAIDLVNGESETEAHLKRNPLGYVPVLQWPDRTLIESVAIIEWLEEQFPKPALYPGDSFQRARIRSLVEIINADTQPIQNLTVMDKYSSDEQKRKEWNQFFIRRGLTAFETLCRETAGHFSVGDAITAADLFLIPQCYNAARFEVPLEAFPTIKKIYDRARATPECRASAPENYKPAP